MLDQAQEPHQQAAGKACSDPGTKHHHPHLDRHQRSIGRRRQHIRLSALQNRFRAFSMEYLSVGHCPSTYEWIEWNDYLETG
jgi:hypothetical protein